MSTYLESINIDGIDFQSAVVSKPKQTAILGVYGPNRWHLHSEKNPILDLGYMSTMIGDWSIDIGAYNETKNDGEIVLGSYNRSWSGSTSDKKTKFSIGAYNLRDNNGLLPPESIERKNLFEIMRNGDVYVNGLGDYDGTNGGDTYTNSLQKVISDKADISALNNYLPLSGGQLTGDLVLSMNDDTLESYQIQLHPESGLVTIGTTSNGYLYIHASETTFSINAGEGYINSNVILTSGSLFSDYISPDDIGAAPTSHTHSASDITSGTLALARIPTGITSSTVALGNHTHSNYATTSQLDKYLPLTGGTLTGSLSLGNLSLSRACYGGLVGDNTLEVYLDDDSNQLRYTLEFNGGEDGFVTITPNSIRLGNTQVSLEGHTHTVSQISNLGSGWNTVLTSAYAAPEVVITPEIFNEYIENYGYYNSSHNTSNYRVLFPNANSDVESHAEGGEIDYRRLATKEDVDSAFRAKFTTGIDCLSSSGVWTNPTNNSPSTWFDQYVVNSSSGTSTWVGRDVNGDSCFNRVGASYVHAHNGFFQQEFSLSDERLKNITAELDGQESLNNLLGLRTVRFQWKDSGKDAIGLIAQDVEKIYPELVSEHVVTGMKGISYEHVVPILISALRYMQDEINQLRDEISKK